MNKLLFCAALCLAIAGSAFSQPINTPKGSKSDEIFIKMRKVDLLNQILPLLLTKDQINKELLPAIEKARAKQKQILADEDVELEKLDPELSDTIKKAVEKSEYPNRDLLTRVAKKTAEMSIKRQLAMGEIVENIGKVLDETLSEGQKKAMEGSFSAGTVDPGKKPEEVTALAKRNFFIRNVLLDPLTRELLIEIADHSN